MMHHRGVEGMGVLLETNGEALMNVFRRLRQRIATSRAKLPADNFLVCLGKARTRGKTHMRGIPSDGGNIDRKRMCNLSCGGQIL